MTEKLKAPSSLRWPLPAPGEKLHYILTSAQNNTELNKPCWENLRAYAKHLDAALMVATFTYNKTWQGVTKQKTSKESDKQPEWWVKDIEPFVCDERVQLAPGLVWCGELQILPTAVDPISGFESYTGRKSTILPHPKFAVKSMPSPKGQGTKFLYTSGTVTRRNYIQKKTGQRAEFHHGYGALIVEVDSDGSWFVRQLCAENDGTFYDFDIRVKDGEITEGHRPEALVWGDIHERSLERRMRDLCFGRKGILDTLRPRHQAVHDVLDFRSQNHHDRDDSWKTFAKFVQGGMEVEKEVKDSADFLLTIDRPWCKTAVVCSNHDMALVRWLKEADFRADPLNAMFFLEASHAAYLGIQRGEDFHVPEWAMQRAWPLGTKVHNIRFLRRDEPYTVCIKRGGGIELGMHGDVGANGARVLNLRTFAKSGRKCIVGHSHSAGWFEGARQVGVLSALDQGYNEGMSSWSHTNAIVYPNGKTTLFTIWNWKWRA